MNILHFIVLQQSAQGSALGMFLPLVLIIIVFYFFMIRPQMKRQKELQKFRDALQKGDKVVTTGGIYGRIDEIKDNYIFLEVAPNVKLRIDKTVVLKDISDADAAQK